MFLCVSQGLNTSSSPPSSYSPSFLSFILLLPFLRPRSSLPSYFFSSILPSFFSSIRLSFNYLPPPLPPILLFLSLISNFKFNILFSFLHFIYYKNYIYHQLYRGITIKNFFITNKAMTTSIQKVTRQCPFFS